MKINDATEFSIFNAIPFFFPNTLDVPIIQHILI